jgi:CubicO group peptidase (beta-lactamase class C family)
MEYIKDMLKDYHGCISIKKNGIAIFEQAYGYSDLSNKVSNTLDTRFATASAGKVFVAVAILKLIEEGRLGFDDSIGEILDFDLNKIDSNITVKQLLNHTSGIPDYCDESVIEDYSDLWRDYPNYKIRTSRDLLPLFVHKPMMYQRGEKF